MVRKIKTHPRYARPSPKSRKATKIQRAYKIVKRCFLSVLLLASIIFASLVGINYHNSLDWSRNKNSLKMAQMSPDMLQDSPKQIMIKEKFIKLADQMLKPDGSINATEAKLITLKHYLNQIKTAKPQYQTKYQKIADKYTIELALASLFKHDKLVDANLDKVHKVLTTIGPALNGMHQKNPKDKFVEEQMRTIHALNHDLRLIKTVATNTANLVIVKKDVATFKPSVVYTDYQQAVEPEDKLIYQWKVLTPFNQLQPDIRDVLATQEHKIALYKSYKNDLHNREQAYEDLRKARLTHKANNAQALEQIRQERLQKQREKEAAERAKQAAENNNNSQDNGSTDDNSSNNNSSTTTNNNQTHKAKKPAISSNNKKKPKVDQTKPSQKPEDHYIDPDDTDKSSQTYDDQTGN